MSSRGGTRAAATLSDVRGSSPEEQRATIAARYTDKPPFSQAAFRQATLTPLTNQGGHMPVTTVTINGQRYVAKVVSEESARYNGERWQHDMAARGIARAVGLGDVTLPVYHMARDGTNYIISPFITGKSLEKVVKGDHVTAVQAFRLMPEETRKEVAIFSYVIGEVDRVKPNFMVEGTRGSYSKVYAIDFTRAFTSTTTIDEHDRNGPLLKQGIGGGARSPWRSVALPTSFIQRVASHGREMEQIARHWISPHTSGLSNNELAIRARVGILQRTVEKAQAEGRTPTFGDLEAEARAYPRQLWQMGFNF